MRRLLRLAGRENIPVHVGRPDPLAGGHEFPAEWRTATDDLPGVDLPVLQAERSAVSAVKFLTRRMGNFYIDPEAARRVFDSSEPITLVPLDATNHVPLNRSYIAALEPHAERKPLAGVVVQILELVGGLLDADEAFAWDPLAVVSIVDPAVVTTRKRAVGIRLAPPEAGRSVVAPERPARVDVALSADEGRFRDVFVNSLAGRVHSV